MNHGVGELSLLSLGHGTREHKDGQIKPVFAPLFVDQLLDSQPIQGVTQDEIHVLRVSDVQPRYQDRD